MSDHPVIIEQHPGWAELIINRPERRNAIIPPVSLALTDALRTLENNDDVQSVILRGADGYFCSGIDLKALQADPPPPWRDEMGSSSRELHLTLYGFRKPIIGALESYAINAGSALALACDILISGESAFLQVGEIQQGVGMPMNAAWFKIKSTETVLARIAFYGDRVNGAELVELGLATEAVTDDKVLSRCREIATRLAGFPNGASTLVKEAIINQRNIDDPETFFPKAAGGSLLNAGKVTG